MSFGIALAMLAQAAFTPPPSPPAIAAPGTEVYQRQQASFESDLQRSCLSAEGVRLATESWARNRARAASQPKSPDSLQYDIAATAYTLPVDMNGLEQALKADAAMKAADAAAKLDEAIALLRSLSPADRAIYARRHTWMRPTTPAPVCLP